MSKTNLKCLRQQLLEPSLRVEPPGKRCSIYAIDTHILAKVPAAFNMCACVCVCGKHTCLQRCCSQILLSTDFDFDFVCVFALHEIKHKIFISVHEFFCYICILWETFPVAPITVIEQPWENPECVTC